MLINNACDGDRARDGNNVGNDSNDSNDSNKRCVAPLVAAIANPYL